MVDDQHVTVLTFGVVEFAQVVVCLGIGRTKLRDGFIAAVLYASVDQICTTPLWHKITACLY